MTKYFHLKEEQQKLPKGRMKLKVKNTNQDKTNKSKFQKLKKKF